MKLSGYTQSNKKADMAAKMVTKYNMNGSRNQGNSETMKTLSSGGMKPKMVGRNSGRGGGEKYPEQGPGKTGGPGEKAKMANSKAKFSNQFYTQTAK